ncbi:hypothetical protein K505DRAFT_337866 [Melanomma pulvis-pyrius CBS 109.77]|uniref:DUF7770 domain-containing protein n=1 Tax=Melanomma pulvis-pyrius CBS 109.77 TaxID=1314802 RepID=A0A6A6XAW2_9PLEO|nr:hypothetical protein K505DRAFT_337866 [Melanomma pulvis-pyrius CBS 109.77]
MTNPENPTPTILVNPENETIRTHTVGLDNKIKANFENSYSVFRKMRIEIHKNNHVTTLLLLDGGDAVRINMTADEGDLRGQLDWSEADVSHLPFEVASFDIDLGGPVEVRVLYRAITEEWHLHQYLFPSIGNGSHFWIVTLLEKMASAPSIFYLQSGTPSHAKSLLAGSLSNTSFPTIPCISADAKGTFYSKEEWQKDWFGCSKEESEQQMLKITY